MNNTHNLSFLLGVYLAPVTPPSALASASRNGHTGTVKLLHIFRDARLSAHNDSGLFKLKTILHVQSLDILY